MQTSLISADSGGKARPVAEAQPRQEWRDSRCSFPKIFLFCKYLTWIIQIRTCWRMADCCFYWCLFRESTEDTLSQPLWTQEEEKQNKNGRFLEGKPAWRSLWCEELLLADWPAGTTPALECLELTWEGTLAVLQHDRTWSKLGAQKPWSTFLRLGCRLDLEQYTWNTSVSPSMLGSIGVVVEEKPGGLFFFFGGGRGRLPVRVWCCCFGQMERNMEEVGLKSWEKNLLRGE